MLIRLLFSKNCDFAVSHNTQVWPVPTKTKLTSGSKHYPYKFIILTVLLFKSLSPPASLILEVTVVTVDVDYIQIMYNNKHIAPG